MTITTDSTDRERIREYYGRILSGSGDLRTDACCTAGGMPAHLAALAAELPDEVVTRFYGCGSPIPAAIEGCRVLDLGCGTGRDAFLCAGLAGEEGEVIGLDMTSEQIEVARRHALPNTRFVHGYMEDLAEAGVEDDSVDVVISNCVLNLSPEKERVFSEIFRVLRPGGELLFSDVFADRRPPEEWREDPVLLGECLAGAMYVEDFRRLLDGLGVPDHRIVTGRPIAIENPEIEAKVGSVGFSSLTVRAFKLATIEDRCEDYGQVAVYRGTIPHEPNRFVFDDHHVFETDRPMTVCGNTAAMLRETRYGEHFEVRGDRSRHFGLFPCAAEPAAGGAPAASCC